MINGVSTVQLSTPDTPEHPRSPRFPSVGFFMRHIARSSGPGLPLNPVPPDPVSPPVPIVYHLTAYGVPFMARTLGIHWIATTFGTWLHGDVRGSWRHGKLIGTDPFLESAIHHRMRDDAVVLDESERQRVENAFAKVIREINHRAYAATIQATHVHIVFSPLRLDVLKVIAKLKYRAVLDARRNMRRDDIPATLWTEGQFPVFIFDIDHLQNAIEYVRRHNTRAALPADPYAWITPIQ